MGSTTRTVTAWAKRGALVAGALAAVASITATLRASDADVPRKKELEATRRVATATQGGADVRAPLVPRGSVSGSGLVEPADREIKVGAPLSGLVGKVLVAEGDRVKAGQPLVRLTDEVERAQVVAAEADVTSAEAQLARAREGRRPEEIAAMDADARAAAARESLARTNQERATKLKAQGAATEDEYDRARFGAEMDRAAHDAGRARVKAAQGGWQRDVQVVQTQVSQARARLSEARARLERLTVRAPRTGTVLQIVIREGEYYNTLGGGHLLTLGDLSKLRVRLDVYERDIAKVDVGQRGSVTVEAFGDRRFGGTVVDVARRMGRKNLRTDEPTERIDTRIREVLLELDDGHELLPGLRAIATLEPPVTASL
jgi:ABC exporter DevB family membrane fusion protein